MDMLYSQYSNPLDLMNMYINQGRFGDFVVGFCTAEYERKKEQAEKDLDTKLWMAYINSHSDLSFNEWKNANCKTNKTTRGSDESLDNEGIKAIINDLFPEKSSQGGDA